MKKKLGLAALMISLFLTFSTSAAFAEEATQAAQPKHLLELNLNKEIPSFQNSEGEVGKAFINAAYDCGEYECKHLYSAAAYFDGRLYISREVFQYAFPEIEIVVNENTTVFKKGNRIVEAERYGYLRLDGEKSKEIKVGLGAIRIGHDGDYLDELVPVRPILEHLGYEVKYKTASERVRPDAGVEVYSK